MKYSYLLLMVIFISCQTEKKEETPVNYYQIPTFSEDDVLQAVVEIPAGTNKKIEYRKEGNVFQIDSLEGKERSINFLPYPGNYGFIPSTFSDPARGGDGDALDVLIIAESLPTKSIVPIIPVGMIRLIDEGESDYKIIAIPEDKSKRILAIENFEDLSNDYPEVRKILNDWFSYYDNTNSVFIESWTGENSALEEVEKWRTD